MRSPGGEGRSEEPRNRSRFAGKREGKEMVATSLGSSEMTATLCPAIRCDEAPGKLDRKVGKVQDRGLLATSVQWEGGNRQLHFFKGSIGTGKAKSTGVSPQSIS